MTDKPYTEEDVKFVAREMSGLDWAGVLMAKSIKGYD